MTFTMNDILWKVQMVSPFDKRLVDRTGRFTLGTTDPVSHEVCISNSLTGGLLTRVTIHEICHCAIVSHGLLDDIHRCVYPSRWVEAEELVCNLMADYGLAIFDTAYKVLGSRAMRVVPQKLEELLR